MRTLPAIGAAAFVLGGCQAEDTAANNASEVTVLEQEAPATDPATVDLNLDATPSEVDRAINQTEAQSNLDRAIEDTSGSIENGM